MSMADDIIKLLGKISHSLASIKVIGSNTEAEFLLKSNHNTSLIFSNVILNGDSTFAIFKKNKVNTPVIYYADNASYAVDAYHYNAIGYMLKPLTKKAITDSIEIYKNLYDGFNKPGSALNELTNPPKKNNVDSSLIITWKDKIIPVKIKDIALFNIEYKMTQAITFTNRKYFIANTLEDLEEICGRDFYRANRQFLINREVVAEASQHFARKLVLKLKVDGEHEIIISKNRVPEFLSWLRN
jgi:two-component system response regulator LytT